MRTLSNTGILLGTFLCFASHAWAYMLDEAETNNLWEQAILLRQEQLKELTQNGSTSRVRRSTKVTPESEIMSENSNIYPFFEQLAMEKHHLTKRQAQNQQTPAACQRPSFNCNGAANLRYRNIDGTCNNLNNPTWGSRNQPFTRIAQVAYDDGVNTPRGASRNSLPNPRVISNTIHFDNNPLNRFVTNMIPQFGQFLDHDITMTPEAASSCCQNPRSNVDCWAIPIPQNDNFYSSRRQTCMDFTRSTTCTSGGVRQQVNAITAYIDGSQIYGSDPQRTRSLRSFTDGLLATNPSLNGFLPTGNQRGVQVQGTFVAGDDRINEMPGLAVMHNVFLMEHNRIAREFRRMVPNANDEVIFQETRRVVIALLQNIVYSEYLPIVLGDTTMNEYGLWLPNQGFSSYSSNTDATIFNSFATAAYRFGHSMIAGVIRLISGRNTQVGSYNVADNYFISTQITQSNGQGYDLILRGLFTQNAPEMDRHCTDGVRNFLFKQPNQNFGSDLIARNIQRGRDHGLPSWLVYRQLCGGDVPQNWQSWSYRPSNVDPDGWSAAQRVYATPADIDLFVGGLIETPDSSRGGLTGITFQCMKAVQFKRLKDGDRYFFTHRTGPYAFTPQQITAIRSQRFSDIICRNSQQPDVPANAFVIPSSANPSIQCASRTPLNLNAFTT